MLDTIQVKISMRSLKDTAIYTENLGTTKRPPYMEINSMNRYIENRFTYWPNSGDIQYGVPENHEHP